MIIFQWICFIVWLYWSRYVNVEIKNQHDDPVYVAMFTSPSINVNVELYNLLARWGVGARDNMTSPPESHLNVKSRKIPLGHMFYCGRWILLTLCTKAVILPCPVQFFFVEIVMDKRNLTRFQLTAELRSPILLWAQCLINHQLRFSLYAFQSGQSKWLPQVKYYMPYSKSQQLIHVA